MATVQRYEIREYMVDHFRLGRRGTNDATQSDKSTLSDDSEFGGRGGAAGIEVGSEVVARMDSTAGGGGTITTASGRVDKKPTLSGGTVTFDPLLTALGEVAVVANNDCTFDILFAGLKVRRLHEAINKALEKVPEKLLVPITLVTDGDMLGLTAVTPNWTGSSAADGKVAASFPWGLREMLVENSGANGYTATAGIPVEAGASYFLEATARVSTTPTTNTARLDVFDLTGSAAIDLDDDNTTEQEPTILWNPSVIMPTGAELVEIRLGGDETDAEVSYSNVQFRKNESRHFTIQDRMEVDRLGRLFATTNKNWHTRGDTLEEIAAEAHMLGAGLWEYRIGHSVGGRALFYEEFSKRGTLTVDTSTTTAPKEDVAAIAADILLTPFRRDEQWAEKAQDAAAEAAVVVARYESQREYVNKARKAVFLPAV